MVEPTEDERKEAVRLAATPKPDPAMVELAVDMHEALNDIRFKVEQIERNVDAIKNKKAEFHDDWKADKRMGKYIGMFMATTSAVSVWIMVIGLMYLPEETRKLFRTLLDFFGISAGV